MHSFALEHSFMNAFFHKISKWKVIFKLLRSVISALNPVVEGEQVEQGWGNWRQWRCPLASFALLNEGVTEGSVDPNIKWYEQYFQMHLMTNTNDPLRAVMHCLTWNGCFMKIQGLGELWPDWSMWKNKRSIEYKKIKNILTVCFSSLHSSQCCSFLSFTVTCLRW